MVPFSGPIGFKSLIVGQAWSTCYEVYFYTLFALLLFAGVSKKWLLPLITALFAIGFTIWRYYPSGGFCGYLLSLFGAQHVLFFCEGIVIALMASGIQRFEIKKGLLTIIAMLSLMAYITFMCRSYSFFTSLVVSPVVFIVVYKANEIVPENGIVHRSMLTLGDISFSIYLIHSVVIRFLLNQCHIDDFWSLLLVTLVVTILLSLLCYTLVEKRFIDFGKQLSLKFI